MNWKNWWERYKNSINVTVWLLFLPPHEPDPSYGELRGVFASHEELVGFAEAQYPSGTSYRLQSWIVGHPLAGPSLETRLVP